MKNGKIVVLQALGGLKCGGAESRVMDITRRLDNTNIEYDFLLHDKGPDFYEDEASSLGANIYRVPAFRIVNYFSYVKALNRLFQEHKEIDIVQGHITSSAAIYLPIAKKHGVKVTIAHGRSAGVDKGIKGILTRVLRKNLYKKCDLMWACSPEAGESVYGKARQDAGRVRVIPNAIDVDKFSSGYDKDEIEALKQKYKLADKFVVGHVGSFRYAKNHEFLIDIFVKLLEKKEDAVLLLVGDGERRQEMEDKCSALGIKDKVIFAGNHGDVYNFYQLMDLIIFPSRYEGLPGTIVESQAAGVPSLISTAITGAVGVTSLVKYLGLDETSEKWADEAISLYENINNEKAGENWKKPEEILKEKGFDVNSQVLMLADLYADMIK